MLSLDIYLSYPKGVHNMYCPYTDREIESDAANSEHIIPLSLGGSNQFVIDVDAKFNCNVGSKIDGVLANDFLVLSRRIKLDARGHSNKKPSAKNKSSVMGKNKKPVQIDYFSPGGFEVFDPIARRLLIESEISGETFESRFVISRYGRLKFSAKVALASGYFIFGEWFRQNVAHCEVRLLMSFDFSSEPQGFEKLQLRVYDEFMPASDVDQQQRSLDEFFCGIVKGSCVYFIPGPTNIGITIGVLGKYIATLNIPANTDNFPFSDENDLGHAIILENGKMTRMSYRELARKAYKYLESSSHIVRD